MTQDGLAIGTSINQGEAQILPRTGFRDFSEKILRLAEREAQDQREGAVMVGKLLSEDITSQWQQDQMNYFQPKADELKKETVNLFKQSNGKLTPIQQFELKQKWNKLESEAKISNAMFSEYGKQASELTKNPDKYDMRESAEALDKFRNPYKYEDTKKQIQDEYGGDINKWRSENIYNYGIKPVFSKDAALGEIMKDEKPDEAPEVDPTTGKPIEHRFENGLPYYNMRKEFAPKQLDRMSKIILNPTTRKGEKLMTSYVSDMEGVKWDNGIILYPPTISEDEQAYINNEVKKSPGQTDQERANKILKAHIEYDISSHGTTKYQPHAIGNLPQPKAPKEDNNSWEKNFRASVTPSAKSGEGKVVTYTKIKGGDIKFDLPNSTKPILNPGFFIGKDGNLYAKVQVTEEVPQTNLVGKQLKDSNGVPIVKEKKVNKEILIEGTDIAPSAAAEAGFNTFEAFKSDVAKRSTGTAQPKPTVGKKPKFDPNDPL